MANPLATADQRAVDRIALAVRRSAGFSDSETIATAAYLASRAGLIPPSDDGRLANAVEELVFGMIQTASNNDPFRPRVYWLGAAPHRWFGASIPGGRWAYDNPDTFYRTVPIDPSSRYRIRGRLTGAGSTDLAFSLVDDLITQTTVDYVDGLGLRSRRRPDYTVTIGPEPAHGRPNHLQTTERTVQLFIRTTISDWAIESPDLLTVERLDGGAIPAPRSLRDVVEEAKLLVARGAPIFGPALLGLKTMAGPPNRLPQPGRTPGALVTQANSFGYFNLADDQALIVTMDPSGAGYMTLPVTDPWMVGISPGRFSSSLNMAQSARGVDGRYSFVISRRDPGFINWVATAGQRRGTIMARWQRLRASSRPSVTTHVVDIDQVRDALPPGARYVTPAQRRRQLQARQSAYLRRFRT